MLDSTVETTLKITDGVWIFLGSGAAKHPGRLVSQSGQCQGGEPAAEIRKSGSGSVH